MVGKLADLLTEEVINVTSFDYDRNLRDVYPELSSGVRRDLFERGMRVAKNLFLSQLERRGITDYDSEGVRGRGGDTVSKVYFNLFVDGKCMGEIASTAVPSKGCEIETWNGDVYLVDSVCFCLNNSGTDACANVCAKKIKEGKVF